MVRSIELPEALAQRLETFASSADTALPALILKTLSPLAEISESLENDDPLVRVRALRRLSMLDAATAVPVLIKALQDENLVVRGAAADSLRRLNALETTDSNQTVLPNRGTPEAIPSLFDLAGTLDTGTTDLGERHDYYIAQALELELLPDE